MHTRTRTHDLRIRYRTHMPVPLRTRAIYREYAGDASGHLCAFIVVDVRMMVMVTGRDCVEEDHDVGDWW